MQPIFVARQSTRLIVMHQSVFSQIKIEQFFMETKGTLYRLDLSIRKIKCEFKPNNSVGSVDFFTLI